MAGDIITITRAGGGPVFDADTRVSFKGFRTFILTGGTADAIQVVIPGVGSIGSVELLLVNMGPGQVAQKTTFTSNSASLDDKTEPNDDPLTAPTAVNGDTYIILHGTCTDGVVTDPGDDCDDYFTVANATPAAPVVSCPSG